MPSEPRRDVASLEESQATIEELKSLGAATLGESGARCLSPRLRPVYEGACLAGPAITALCSSGDNLAIHAAIAEADPGSVLVAATEGDPGRGYFGEVLATAAQTRSMAGLVIDAGVRDTEALERLAFPVFSSAIALRGATKHGPGTIGAPVVIADVEMEGGDWVVADRDGVVCIAATELATVMSRARERAKKEEVYFRSLRSGTTTVELLGLDTSPITRG